MEREHSVTRPGRHEGTDAEQRLLGRIAELEERLARLEGAVPSADGATGERPTEGTLPPTDQVVGRRALLGSAGRVAAGALAGGTALALTQAGPAAAASGAFDGNPALTASNTGGAAGLAISAVGNTGAGLRASTFGTNPSQPAIDAQHNNVGNGAALKITSSGGYGVFASTTSSINPLAYFNHQGSYTTVVKVAHNGGVANSVGLDAFAQRGVVASGTKSGVEATSGGGLGVAAQGKRADVIVGTVGGSNYGAPTSRDHTAGHQSGELVGDGNTGDLWACVTNVPAGQTGTWRKLAGPGTAGSLHVLPATVRVFDSRAGFPPANPNKGRFTNEQRVIDTTFNSSGVPAGATAVLVNLAVTNTNSGGFGALFRNGIVWPGNASINWGLVNTTTSNMAVVAVDAAAKLLCKIEGSTDVIIDVVGYFQ